MRLLFERDLTPHPQYAAFYQWLQHEGGAHAVVHLGMHGTVEWLPGAPLGAIGFFFFISWLGSLCGTVSCHVRGPTLSDRPDVSFGCGVVCMHISGFGRSRRFWLNPCQYLAFPIAGAALPAHYAHATRASREATCCWATCAMFGSASCLETRFPDAGWPLARAGNTGLSWSDVLLGNLPNVYVYACNNPSESIVAKRRGYATVVSYNVPPYGRWMTDLD